MPIALYVLLALLALPPVFLNLVGPLVVWATVKIPAKFEFEPVEEGVFFADRDADFCSLDRYLRHMALDYLVASTFQNGANTSYFSVYVHPSSQTTVSLIRMEGSKQQFNYVELTRRDRSGKLISVNNAQQVSAYPPMPNLKLGLHYPQEWDIKALWQRLDRLQQHLEFRPAGLPEGEGEYLRIVANFLEREAAELVRLGYCRRSIDAQGQRSLTVKGAYLMSWQLVFPGKQLRLRSQRRYAQQFCDSVGL